MKHHTNVSSNWITALAIIPFELVQRRRKTGVCILLILSLQRTPQQQFSLKAILTGADKG
ncbi:hypothetical protein [Ochrobactrum sp. Marseille-Q0166]|uniref:hypothetical protein n=1 Tax=Ochrobactrum sp. Marseille-Q0166 TaxID=2761105 RepID=UPI00165532AF|nr:hypothetical protein [Ochrobactrum sp. Marseille-Q0166]MBC8718573.1 hypothetical protein [Ochrobactrum sp. Marseille-Q0166]